MTQAVPLLQRDERTTQMLGLPFLRSAGGALFLLGGWCIGVRVEAGWDSGTVIADDILARGSRC